MNLIHSKKYPTRQSDQYNDVELFKIHERRLCNLYEIAIRTEKLQNLIYEFAKELEELNKKETLSSKEFFLLMKPFREQFSEYNLHPEMLYLNYSFLHPLSKKIHDFQFSLMNKIKDDSSLMQPEINFIKDLKASNTYLFNLLNVESLFKHEKHYKVNDIKKFSEIGCVVFELIKLSLHQKNITYGGASTTYTFPFSSRPVILNNAYEKRTMLEVNLGLSLEENISLLEKIYKNKGIVPNDCGLSLIGQELKVSDFDKHPKYFADALFIYDYYISAEANDYNLSLKEKITNDLNKELQRIKADETLSPYTRREQISNQKKIANKNIRLLNEKLLDKIKEQVLPTYTTKAIKTTYLEPMQKLIKQFQPPIYKHDFQNNFSSFK